jgi:mannitol-1-phosphate 5-dehydrogenase
VSTSVEQRRSTGNGCFARGRAVIIGPGKLGCGYLLPLFLDAGWHSVLVARSAARTERIRAAGGFQVRAAPGGESRRLTCAAVPFGGASFRAAVAEADLVVTAVGAENVATLGPGLALALAARSPTSPIDVLVVENADLAPVLEEAVRRAASRAATPLPPVGFAGVIAYPIVARGDWEGRSMPEFVRDRAEGLLVDSSRLLRPLPELPSLEETRDYQARLREKLFVFGAGHALCAYLGARCGYERVDEAARDPLVRAVVRECLLEARSGIECTYLALDDVWMAVNEAMRRYENEELEDPIRRVARSPLRKLASTGPLVGAAKLVRGVCGRTSTPFALGIASALLYRDQADPQARELEARLRLHGVGAVLRQVCSLDTSDPLFPAVVVAYERMRQGESAWWHLATLPLKARGTEEVAA